MFRGKGRSASAVLYMNEFRRQAKLKAIPHLIFLKFCTICDRRRPPSSLATAGGAGAFSIRIRPEALRKREHGRTRGPADDSTHGPSSDGLPVSAVGRSMAAPADALPTREPR